MKITTFLNRIKTPYKNDFESAKNYFASMGVTFDFEMTTTDVKGYKVDVTDFGSVGKRYEIKGEEKLVPVKGVTILVIDGGEFAKDKTPVPTTQIFDSGILITMLAYKEGVLNLKHELMHSLFAALKIGKVFIDDPMDIFYRNGVPLMYYKNDDPYAPDGNFSEAWKRLGPYIELFEESGPVAPRWKWFKDNEVVGLKTTLVDALDTARGLAGVPFTITSGYRTKEQNAAVGGAPNSAHTKGLAVDLRTKDSKSLSQMLYGLLMCGTPVFLEICRSHIHVDIDSSIHLLGTAIWANDD